jgi:hypothetical protein
VTSEVKKASERDSSIDVLHFFWVHPRVIEDVLEGYSMLRLYFHHLVDKIHQWLAEMLDPVYKFS